ncbi:MAG TPA: hypothetical protein VFQ58_02455 [Flavisolibacter sp.]|nr:hypothetical protein [Flavisolibacter sp.]
MRAFILFIILVISTIISKAQSSLNALPAGKYETIFKANQNKWDKGDIIILDENRYKMSTSEEIGEYRFSVTVQRVFFISGPLKSIFAKTSLSNNIPSIVLPQSENEHVGLKLPSEVCGYYRQ